MIHKQLNEIVSSLSAVSFAVIGLVWKVTWAYNMFLFITVISFTMSLIIMLSKKAKYNRVKEYSDGKHFHIILDVFIYVFLFGISVNNGFFAIGAMWYVMLIINLHTRAEAIKKENDSSNTINAPWSNEQVRKINDIQGGSMVHPYVCIICKKELVATRNGLTCIEHHYTQEWCHIEWFRAAGVEP